MESKGENTLRSIPARARAVYPPREKPKMHILSPYSSVQNVSSRIVSRGGGAITYSFALEICIQLEDGVSLFWANKEHTRCVRTLGVKWQTPSDSSIQDLGNTTGGGVDEPWGVTRGVSANARLIFGRQHDEAIPRQLSVT